MHIRPVTRNDLDAVLRIATIAGIGMTSLPPDREVLGAKVERAAQTFEGSLADEGDALYMFVMEDPADNTIVGTCGIEGHIGMKRPIYSYKITTVTQYSDSMDIFSRNDMLQMVNDYTGVSEMVSLFLDPAYRRDRLGRFLSRVRFLFMALHRKHFDDRIIAEIRGWHDGQGNAPFYDSLAKHFFQMEFAEADAICATKGNRFISELMPTYPIYISLLPEDARNVIGRPYASSEAAKAMLEREGFAYNGYVDIFDGGPTLEARTNNINTVQATKQAIIKAIEPLSDPTQRTMLARAEFEHFKACLGFMQSDNEVIIDPNSAATLELSIGDTVAYVQN